MENTKNKNIIKDFNYYINNPEYSPQLEYMFSHCAENHPEIINYYQQNTEERAKSDVVNHLFPYTNEDLTKFYEHLKNKKQKVLTTGSSGDQALIAILNGANNVTVADLNMYTKMWTELKIAGIKNLSYNDFCKYFNFDQFAMTGDFEDNFYRYPKVYSAISHSLSPEVQNFWDTLMLDGDCFEMSLLNFAKANIDHENVPYLLFQSKYYKLQDILNKNEYKINYIVDELSNFPKRVKDKYDFIDLSNIVDYYNKNNYSDKSSKSFFKIVDHLYNKNLRQKGTIRVTSSYERLDDKNKVVSKLKQKYGNENIKKLPQTGLFGCYSSLLINKNSDQEHIKHKYLDETYSK